MDGKRQIGCRTSDAADNNDFTDTDSSAPEGGIQGSSTTFRSLAAVHKFVKRAAIKWGLLSLVYSLLLGFAFGLGTIAAIRFDQRCSSYNV